MGDTWIYPFESVIPLKCHEKWFRSKLFITFNARHLSQYKSFVPSYFTDHVHTQCTVFKLNELSEVCTSAKLIIEMTVLGEKMNNIWAKLFNLSLLCYFRRSEHLLAMALLWQSIAFFAVHVLSFLHITHQPKDFSFFLLLLFSLLVIWWWIFPCARSWNVVIWSGVNPSPPKLHAVFIFATV